jgi:hypothetical protein
LAPTHWQRIHGKAGLGVWMLSTQHTSMQTQRNGARAVEGNLGGFCVCATIISSVAVTLQKGCPIQAYKAEGKFMEWIIVACAAIAAFFVGRASRETKTTIFGFHALGYHSDKNSTHPSRTVKLLTTAIDPVEAACRCLANA